MLGEIEPPSDNLLVDIFISWRSSDTFPLKLFLSAYYLYLDESSQGIHILTVNFKSRSITICFEYISAESDLSFPLCLQ